MLRSTCCLLCILFLFAIACTPKATTPVVEVEEEKKPEPIEIGPCANWFDSGKQDYAETEHVLYRDAMKRDDYDQAYLHWQNVFAIAPMADGKRRTHFEDGIKLYHHFFETAETDAQKKAFIDSVMAVYDHMALCNEEDINVEGRKGFDYYYKYQEYTDDETIYNLFKASMDKYGLETDYFVLNPFTALILQRYAKGEITMEEAQHYSNLISARLKEGLENCEDEECEAWKIIAEYTPSRLEEFEGVRGFYDCDYYAEKYWEVFLASPQECEVIQEVLARLKFGGCADDNEKIVQLREALSENCRVASTEPGPLRKAYTAYQNGEYQDALTGFEEYVNNTEDPEKKAKYLLLIAKIYYANFKNFPQSRKYARLAAAQKENWGEPYILIGKLYASSGPLCGTGRGFNSQRVVWPALDMFNLAKRIDPSVASEANKWINQYAQYMPDKEDLFMMGIKEGSQYTVPCWINETTTARGN